MFRGNKRYNNIGAYLRGVYGERAFKVCIDAGFTCPNRDGSKGRGGCIYCNVDSFTPNEAGIENSVRKQLDDGIKYQKERYGGKKFIAYFQAFSSTYGEVDYLKRVYEEALRHPEVVGLSIGTRPDCINDEILALISGYAKGKEVWMEYGLQSMHDKTLDLINRGHDLKCFHDTYMQTRKYKDIKICVHVIHGLPNETNKMQLDTIRYLSDIGIDGIKIHQLHVVKKTKMEKMYKRGEFSLMDLDNYLYLLSESLSLLSSDVVIHRLFGLGPKDLLIAPDWDIGKGQFNTLIDKYLEENNYYQGMNHDYFGMLDVKEGEPNRYKERVMV